MKQEHFEILLEEMRSNFQFVLEGHAALRDELNAKIDAFRDESNQKHDLTALLLKTLNSKIDEVKADLSAHRTDTEAHPRWQVREPSE